MKTIFGKEKFSLCFFVFGILLSGLSYGQTVHAAGGAFAGGNGTLETPYQIEDCSDLQAINSHLSSYFILNNDIDCSATTAWNGGAGFDTLGGVVTSFTGSLDGQGHVIQNLYINRPGELYIGMFSWIGAAGVVKNLGIVDANITGLSGFTGVVVSYNAGTLTKVYTTGSVQGGNYAAGIEGYSADGSVTDAYTDVTITSSGHYSGGIVGYFFGGTITRTYAVGHLSGGSLGGAVGLRVFGTASSTFYNTETTGTGSSDGGTGKTTAQMMTQSTFDGWNFTVVGNGTIGSWIMAGYPHFQMEHRSAITSLVELQLMNVDLDDDYTVEEDIDAASTTLWNAGAGFDPVGDANPDGAQFTGTFDGQGHEIDSLYINLPETFYVGLFGYTEAATITHVGLINADITGELNVAAVIGGLFNTTASKLWSSGSVSANRVAGGVAGALITDGATLSQSYSSATVSISGANTAGGLVGFNSGTVSNSYARGDITGATEIGGLVGDNTAGIVINCYATGDIITEDVTRGGLIGSNVDFFFEIEGVVTDSFYDLMTSGQSDVGKGTAKVTLDMRSVVTFTNTATADLDTAWDFVGNPNNDAGNNDYWDEDLGINNGYPFLTFAGLVDETAPSAPTDFVGVASSTDVNLSWTNPEDIDFSSITIRRGATSTPITINSGVLIAEEVTSTLQSDLDLDDGVYYYSIFAVDFNGNVSVAATTSVTVDITVPVITLLGSNAVSVRKDTSYIDAGATASDNIDGNITNDIILTGSVDINTVGTYTLTYTVSDDVGNAATPVVRTVTVTRRHENNSNQSTSPVVSNSSSGSSGENNQVSEPFVTSSSTPEIVIAPLVVTSTPEPIVTPAPVVVPTVEPCTTLLFSQDLRLGDSTEDVKKLQQYLNTHGFVLASSGPGSPGNETTYFGNLTQLGLINFQKSKNIAGELGVLNQSTRELLGCASSVNIVEGENVVFQRNLEMGMFGEDVKQLQVYFNMHGYAIAPYGPGSLNNETLYFGERTKNAVIRFQKDHGIVPALGYFGSVTRQLLNR